MSYYFYLLKEKKSDGKNDFQTCPDSLIAFGRRYAM